MAAVAAAAKMSNRLAAVQAELEDSKLDRADLERENEALRQQLGQLQKAQHEGDEALRGTRREMEAETKQLRESLERLKGDAARQQVEREAQEKLTAAQNKKELDHLRQKLETTCQVKAPPPTEDTDFFVGLSKGWASYENAKPTD